MTRTKLLDKYATNALCYQTVSIGLWKPKASQKYAGDMAILQVWNPSKEPNTKSIEQAMSQSRKWMDEAACIGASANIFFPDKIGDKTDGPWEEARNYCAQCTVRRECLSTALKDEQPIGMRYGMWGGKTPRERDILATKNIR